MKINQWIKDLKETVGDLNEVNGITFKYESYKISGTEEGKRYLIGKGDIINSEELIEGIKDVDLLFSLLALVDGDLPKEFGEKEDFLNLDVEPQHLYDLDQAIPDAKVLKWVKKYGIPLTKKVLELSRVKGQPIKNVLDLKEFKNDIAWLYVRFNLWKALSEDNYEASFAVEEFEHSLGGWKLLHNTRNHLPGGWTTNLKNALATVVSENMKNIQMGVDFDPKTNKYKFTLGGVYLTNIAYFQFSALMTKPDSETKVHLKTCNQCNKLFWAKRTNVEYCYNGCSKQAHFIREKRKAEKIAKQNNKEI